MELLLDVATEDKQSAKSKLPLVECVFFLVVVGLIVFGLISTVSWMRDEGRLPLSQFVLQGELTYVHNSDIQGALAQAQPLGTFMTQDVNQLQHQVEKLPWVASAAIRKQWPDTIKVFLVEHQPAAVWNGQAMLNDTGDVFYADVGELNESDQDIVRLYGPKDTGPLVLETWRKVAPTLLQLDLRISSVVLNERYAWQLILDNGIRLELGQDGLDERIGRFVDLYRHINEQAHQISYVDLRYDTGAAIGWLTEEQEQG